jgi:hypothetical protein
MQMVEVLLMFYMDMCRVTCAVQDQLRRCGGSPCLEAHSVLVLRHALLSMQESMYSYYQVTLWREELVAVDHLTCVTAPWQEKQNCCSRTEDAVGCESASFRSQLVMK